MKVHLQIRTCILKLKYLLIIYSLSLSRTDIMIIIISLKIGQKRMLPFAFLDHHIKCIAENAVKNIQLYEVNETLNTASNYSYR